MLDASGAERIRANDQTLTTDIQAKLYADPATKSANVSVAVKDGVVTLSGNVPSSDVELEAMKVANGTAGVRSVNDQMQVNPSAAMNQLPDAGTSTAAGRPAAARLRTACPAPVGCSDAQRTLCRDDSRRRACHGPDDRFDRFRS